MNFQVLRHYIKVEFLLVLANHNSTLVRAAIMKLLSALLKRTISSELGYFNKHFYPYHLANQISIHLTDAIMFETCIEWVSGLYGTLNAFTSYDSIRIANPFGFNTLLSIITRASANSDFTGNAFRILHTIYIAVSITF